MRISSIPISQTPLETNQHLQIFGWGTPFLSKGPRELHTGRVTVVDRDVCSETLEKRFCAGPSYYGGCQGDDGGAAIFNKTLAGLIDYRSAEYCSNDRPGHLYINLEEYREWIEDTVNSSTMTSASILLIVMASLVSLLKS